MLRAYGREKGLAAAMVGAVAIAHPRLREYLWVRLC